MAITVKWYGLGLQALLDNPTDLEAVTVKLALVTSSYTPDRDTHDFWNDASASELASGNGYTTGGVTLSSVLWGYDATSNKVTLDFADPSWTFTASKTWRYGVVYIDTGTASTSTLIGLLDWGADNTVNTAYTLTIDTLGLLYLDTT